MNDCISLAIESLKKNEGFRKFAYQDTLGIWTIGYGRNVEDRGLTEAEAEHLLQNDIMEALSYLRHEPYWVALDERRAATLIELCVNMGWPRLSGFKKMRDALGKGDYARAADELKDSKWFTQVGRRGPEMVDRLRHGTT